MSTLPRPLHFAARGALRASGIWQTRNLSSHRDGGAPSEVLAAVREALLGHKSHEEQVWIDRIEASRAALLTSPTEFQMTRHGAGPQKGGTVRTIGAMTRSSSKPPRWAELLFRLVRSTRATSLLELGSCVGISAAYQAAALELNEAGKLITLEGVDILAARSRQTLEEVGLSHRAEVRVGEFGTTLPGAIADLAPIDYAFIDGNHQEAATIEYADRLHPHLAPEAVLVFDDINWSAGMARAWQRVVSDPRYALTVDLRFVGVAVVSASAAGSEHLRFNYS